MGLGISIAVDDVVDEELAAAVSVEVIEKMGEATTFRLDYAVDIAEGDIPWLVDGRLDPGSDISILVPTESGTECLVKGPIHGHHIHLLHGGAGSTMTVLGSDSSIIMDRETRTTAWDDLSDSDAVSTILANYGYVADVESSASGHFSDKHSLIQRDSDLRFVKRLARRNGFLFWISCNQFGIETAHFKRPDLDELPQLDLIINLDNPNINSLEISWDVERPTSVIGAQLNLNDKSDIDGSVSLTPQTILGDSSLQDITGDTRSIHLLAPVDDAGDLQARGEGTLIESDWFIQATCDTSYAALGSEVIRAHKLVHLRGAGSRYSGSYFVGMVRHMIDAAAHKMELTLLRNGWLG